MKRMLTGFLIIIVLVGCTKDDRIKVQFTGRVQAGHVSTPSSQCGSHHIVAEPNLFILRSDKIDLDLYVGDTVTVFGTCWMVESYAESSGTCPVKSLKQSYI